MIPIAKPYLTKDEAQLAYDTIQSGWVTQGPKVAEFEEKFASYVGSKYAVALSNCTTALHLAMIVTGVQSGDEVICPSMSYIATANSIKYVGATPVFGEVNPETYNLDVNHVESLITDRTKAVLLVHQIGMPADIDAFKVLSEKHNLVLIEDAACAVGASYKGKKIGSHSDIICFSFHPRKVITTGDGGMIATSIEHYHDRIKLLRQHGMSINDQVRHKSTKVLFEEHVEVGYNYRMTDIQASVGIKQIDKLDWIVEERRKIALKYIDSLRDIDCIRLPIEQEGYFSNYQSFSIYLKDHAPISRNELMEKLLENGISSRRGIMTSHREPAYNGEYSNVSLPASEDACDNSIIIPLYIPMDDSDTQKVIDNLRSLLA
ncbi:MAG: DegT/DnrJ/EryC1/StrS family aminotransferase [Bacteroidia bacterium]|nr:DegT/DnrJ/EryC1/StrS family aminotransferase [Bacteroidia bacterium]